MPFYSYITAVAIDDSSSLTDYKSTTPDISGTHTPAGTTEYQAGAYPHTHSTSISIAGGGLTSSAHNIGKNQFNSYTGTTRVRQSILTRTWSLSPLKEVFVSGTYESSSTTTNATTSSSGSTSYTFEGNQFGSIYYLQESYSYTTQYNGLGTIETTETSTIYLFGDSGSFSSSQTYISLANTYSIFNKTSHSTRDSTGSYYLAPQNITYFASLEFLEQNEAVVGGLGTNHTPLLRCFFSTRNDVLISDCDAVLNQTMSTTFSIAGLKRSTGTYASSPANTITLTTNSIGFSELETTRTVYDYSFLTTYENETLYRIYSYTLPEGYASYFEVSGTFTYTYGGLASSAYNSAYSHVETVIIPTTTSIADISCNRFSTFSLLRSLTISTTATSINANQTYVGTQDYVGSRYTYYGNPSFFPVSLHMAYSGFLTSSTQEILLGNFIKNFTDKTAYDNVNSDALAGIIAFTFNASRRGLNGGNYFEAAPDGPRYNSYKNCKVSMGIDPLTTSIELVTINQIVSSFYGTSSGTSISQTVSWVSESSYLSTTRSFEILYTDSIGTSSWTYDVVADNDTKYFNPYSVDVGIYFSAFPAVPITPFDIFATYGQNKNANYMAKGAYFKSNSSAFEFVSTTYTNPISIENILIYPTENYSRISIFTSNFNFNQPLLMNLSLMQYNVIGLA